MTRIGAAAPLLLLILLLGCEPAATGPPRGGEKLLPAAESATYVVVGRIDDRDKIDLHGYASWLRVERSLLPGTKTPPALRIAWEELAAKREPRFAPGDAVLVALTPLPNASLWDRRFPGARADESVLAVAAGGEGYMHNPDGGTLDLLETYLRLPARDRERAAGVDVLARLVASAAPGGAHSALTRIGAITALQELDESSLAPLGAALEDESRPLALRREIVALIRDRRLSALRPQLEGAAAPGSDLRADALGAIGALDGRLPAAEIGGLLSSDDGAVRAVGVRYAAAPQFEERLRKLIKDDPVPAVRAAAATTVIEMNGIAAFADVVPALGDADSTVRLAAVNAVGGLGAAAVAPLTRLVEDGSLGEATGAVLALDRCGGPGRTALMKVAADHRDERVRNVALLALGKLGHEH